MVCEGTFVLYSETVSTRTVFDLYTPLCHSCIGYWHIAISTSSSKCLLKILCYSYRAVLAVIVSVNMCTMWYTTYDLASVTCFGTEVPYSGIYLCYDFLRMASRCRNM